MMAVWALIALISGIGYGLSEWHVVFLDQIADNSAVILNVLMLLVGISVGLRRGLLQRMKEYHIRILVIPFGIVLASFLGGIVCHWLTGYGLAESTAVTSGLGWYSLSGVLVGEAAGPELGSITFLSNLMREIISFFLIPFIAATLNDYTCIAPAAATSEDTTLPILMRYTDEATVVLAVFNGIICSSVVPVLVPLCFTLFR